MLEIYIRNVGISNYEYIVMINAEKIAEGEVKGHKRSSGWVPLVKRIAEQHEGVADD